VCSEFEEKGHSCFRLLGIYEGNDAMLQKMYVEKLKDLKGTRKLVE